MKRIIVLLIMVLILSGCFTKKNVDDKDVQKKEPEKLEKTSDVKFEPLKIGYAINLSHELKEEAETKKLDAISEVAAVLVDQKGKIVDAKFDTSKAKFSYDQKGLVEPKEVTEFPSKMTKKPISSDNKEWYKQMDALIAHLIGKTKDDILNIALDQNGKASSDDLKTAVTIKIDTYLKLFIQAIENAKEMGASTGDKLLLGLYTDSYNSKPDQGKAQAYSFYTIISYDQDDAVTSMIIDATVPFYKYDEATASVVVGGYEDRSKQQLKEEYGMKAASPIKKEWYEQADALAKYLLGKKIDALTTYKLVDNKFEETPEELKTSVTIKVSGIQKAVNYAVQNR